MMNNKTKNAIKLIKGAANTIETIARGLSIAWISPETMVISLPELVSVRLFTLNLLTFVYIAAIRVFLILTEFMYPLKIYWFLKKAEKHISAQKIATSPNP